MTRAGKRQRLREHGLWLMEDETYFTEGNFLVLTLPEEGYAHIVDKYRPVAGAHLTKHAYPRVITSSCAFYSEGCELALAFVFECRPPRGFSL
eukprot:1196390-Prorocentrum_minimum.AAC.7